MSIRILNGGTPTPFPGALNAPSNVVASNPTSTSIDLAWTAPAQGTATEYRVRDNSDDSLVKTVAWPSTGTTVSGLNPDTAYTFYVVTSDGVKDSPKSNTATETTAAAGPAPTGLYVDKTVASSALYDPATRTIGSGSEQCYQTIQDAVNNIISGGAIYIRGAVGGGSETYSENVNLQGSLHPSGSAGNLCSMQSYPGEWAIVDGGHNAQYTIGKIRSGRDGGNDLHFWRFERLEITGGGVVGTSDGAAGLYISGNDNIVRYCYIHDNYSDSGNNNPAGLTGYEWQRWEIEYNWFFNNGGQANVTGDVYNCAHIMAFTEYSRNPPFRTYNLATAMHSNTFRYNYFDTCWLAIKYKGSQWLCDDSGTDFANKDLGDTIHHNICINNRVVGIGPNTDFVQVHNNIIDGSGIHEVNISSGGSQKYHITDYNNTIVNGHIGHNVPYALSLPTATPYTRVMNNIVEAFDESIYFSSDDIGIMPRNSSITTIITTSLTVDCNLIYKPLSDPSHITLGQSSTTGGGEFTVSEYNTAFSTTNYLTSTDGLYLGSSGYLRYSTDETFVVDGATTIANGGIGGAHSYLAGVTIPSYVGASNPNDNAWINGVYNEVADVAWLTSQVAGSTPSWVEA